MTTGTYEHAVLASDAYKDRSSDVDKDPVTIYGVDYRILDVADRSSGYQGTVYQRVDTGEVIIAHRGTESMKDGITDAGMALNGRNNQLGDAMAFTQRAVEKAKGSEAKLGRPVGITITGHSLGGTLAEITAARYGVPAETFNAYGPARLKNLKEYGVNVHGHYPNIVNHVCATDVVGAGSSHFGEVHTYATPQDIESLRRGRYLEAASLHLPTNPLLTADLSAHKMGNFLPHNEITGASIITPVNEARARAYRGAIEHYRQDVAQSGIDLATVAHRAPSPLHQLNPLDPGVKIRWQAIDAGTVMGAAAVVDGVTQVGHAAACGVKVASDGASRGYNSLTGTLFGSKTAASTTSPSMDQPTHPDHALFKQAQAGVHTIDAQNGRPSDERSHSLAAALVVAARRDGLSRIDHVALSTDASKVFAVQGALDSPLKQITSVPTVKALNTPIAQSDQALDASMQRNPSEQWPQKQVRHPEPPQAHRNAGPAATM
ncbi:hypothetical protein QTI24_07595 [Variovorax sp. J22P240]|uniref:XVIPCD domain-containing protein n=1 Tax=Variovorax sp. J22P240 TaxID=3053514 RepID=UPI002576BE3A|nr:XVIPCD domain-containing protein [Variovorax sp. J22P240]MDL9998457.1 hypothetical protein [Variovorax sp. J22P240]